jgi:malate dehydrogenase (oxaloacetate-decarboxylating)
MVFPLSNPTSKSEAKPADLIEWTEGRAMIATGSPFKPVEHAGRTHAISQGNNVYIFPAVGLGALAVGAHRVVDSMFAAAAIGLAEMVTPEQQEEGRLYPPIDDLREVIRKVAYAVGRDAVRAGVAEEPEAGVEAAVDSWIWDPVYPTIQPV